MQQLSLNRDYSKCIRVLTVSLKNRSFQMDTKILANFLYISFYYAGFLFLSFKRFSL